MIEKIIHLTVPKKLTPIQAQTIERARALHPAWEVKVWQDPMLPDGYPLEKYWPIANSGAQLSDLLRLDVVYKWGGVYIDGDMRLLKPLDELVNRFDCFIASHDGTVLTNAIFGARKAHPSIQTLIEELLSNEPDWSLPPDRTTGPTFFSRIVRWDKRVTVLPRETFYSYGPNEKHSRKNHRHSYGEHLWEHSWKEQFPPNRSVSWKSRVKQSIKPVIINAFRIWHRIESLDREASEQQLYSQQPKYYATSDEFVVRTVHGFDIVVDGSDTSITPKLIFGGRYEPPEENFIKRILCGGDLTIDVGSNVGSFCMLAAQRVGSFGRVFAYEPNPATVKLLSKSVAMNRMHDRIVIRPAAVGEIDGNVRLALRPNGLNGAPVGNDKIINSTFSETVSALGTDSLTAIDVPGVTLDLEFPVDLPIRLLRIGAEEHEISVLRGARRLLEHQCIDFIMIKALKEAAGSRWNELLIELKRLTESNYIACTLAPDGSLAERKSLTLALDRLGLENRNIVLKARDQHIFEG
jgi:FkbM family methyltransferase